MYRDIWLVFFLRGGGWINFYFDEFLKFFCRCEFLCFVEKSLKYFDLFIFVCCIMKNVLNINNFVLILECVKGKGFLRK